MNDYYIMMNRKAGTVAENLHQDSRDWRMWLDLLLKWLQFAWQNTDSSRDSSNYFTTRTGWWSVNRRYNRARGVAETTSRMRHQRYRHYRMFAFCSNDDLPNRSILRENKLTMFYHFSLTCQSTSFYSLSSTTFFNISKCNQKFWHFFVK